MPYSPTSGRAHSRNGAEHLRSPTPRPVYSSSSCTIPFMIPCALRACTWCAASPRNVQVRLVCHVSTSVPSVCLRACTCVSVNLDSDHSFNNFAGGGGGCRAGGALSLVYACVGSCCALAPRPTRAACHANGPCALPRGSCSRYLRSALSPVARVSCPPGGPCD